jgi:sulfur-carrier protein
MSCCGGRSNPPPTAPPPSISRRDIRDLFAKLEAEYPGLKPHIERGIAVSINGRIFRDSWDERIPDNAEVYLLPRIAGG